jgi:signal transduction histidine kinase
MTAVVGAFIARGRTDAENRLVQADEPLAGLHQRCGGEMPGVVAIPELLALVRKARAYGLKLARKIRAVDGDEIVSAWVEIEPVDGGDDGCEIGLANWQSIPMPPEDETFGAERAIEIDRALAELTARLDSRQNLLAVDSGAADLQPLIAKMKSGLGAPWTQFVQLPGTSIRQPMHWRLLDGARCEIEGSDRVWTSRLVPHGEPEPGCAGFDLYLVAEMPQFRPDEKQAPKARKRESAQALGRDLSPVLRQPIARIIANAETIRTKLAGPLAEEYSTYAADIASAGQHLLALIDDLADLEVVESDDFTTAPDLIDLGDVARRAAGILNVRAKEKNITLVAPQESENLPAIAEFRRVLQILLNLVGNAINYSPDGSQVWLRLEPDGTTARLTVADQGQGLSEDQQAVVFDKFERLGRGGDGGSGLGLYISRRLARAMNGDLTVESAPGQGARFTLALPSAESQ